MRFTILNIQQKLGLRDRLVIATPMLCFLSLEPRNTNAAQSHNFDEKAVANFYRGKLGNGLIADYFFLD